VKSIAYGLACLAVACAHARTADEYRADTQKLLASKDGEIKACYDKILETKPDAAGLVTFDFAVEAKTGRITDIKSDREHTTAPTMVAHCVSEALKTLALEKGDKKRGQASWSWQFNAGGATKE
jgi:hypothetical protein